MTFERTRVYVQRTLHADRFDITWKLTLRFFHIVKLMKYKWFKSPEDMLLSMVLLNIIQNFIKWHSFLN